jgi:hypothetical protein
MESRGNFDERADRSVHLHEAGRRLHDPVQDLERRGLAGAISADDAEDFARLDLERKIPDRPEVPVVGGLRFAAHQTTERRRYEVAQ